MTALVWNLLLALAWVFVTEQFTPVNLLIGLAVGYLILMLVQRALGPSRYFTKVPAAIGLLLFFSWELVRANIRMAMYVLGPNRWMRPGIVAVPLEPKGEIELTLLANMITLTPGTLSLDVADDRSVLYIHAMDVGEPEEFVREIKDGFERRLRELFA